MTKQTLIRKHRLRKFIDFPQNLDNQHLQVLEQRIDEATLGIEAQTREALVLEKAALLYPIIDPSFLSIRGTKRQRIDKVNCWVKGKYTKGERKREFSLTLPRFAVFPLDNPNFSLTGITTVWYNKKNESAAYKSAEISNRDLQVQIKPSLPEQLEDQLTKAVLLSARTNVPGHKKVRYDWSFSTTFRGLIPQQAKTIIEQTRDIFGDQYYLISEASRWQGEINAEVIRPLLRDNYDPLLIGIDSSGICHLLAEFDSTPMESYVIKEFTSS